MKRKVHLYGALKKYGPVIEMNIATPVQAFRALMTNFPETRKIVADGAFKIVVGDRHKGRQLSEDELNFHGRKDLHIIPVMKGGGGGGRGVAKIVVGAAIIAAAWWMAPELVGASITGEAGLGAAWGTEVGFAGITYGNIAGVGVSMALSGAFQALSPTPKAASYESRESPDQRASFLYNGPVNTVEQGATIPLVYGRMRTGSVLVSAGLSVEQI